MSPETWHTQSERWQQEQDLEGRLFGLAWADRSWVCAQLWDSQGPQNVSVHSGLPMGERSNKTTMELKSFYQLMMSQPPENASTKHYCFVPSWFIRNNAIPIRDAWRHSPGPQRASHRPLSAHHRNQCSHWNNLCGSYCDCKTPFGDDQ